MEFYPQERDFSSEEKENTWWEVGRGSISKETSEEKG